MDESWGAAMKEGSLADVEALRAEVREQLERVRQAIAGNLAYWDAGER